MAINEEVLAKTNTHQASLLYKLEVLGKKKTYFTLLYYDENTETQNQVSVFRINYCR